MFTVSALLSDTTPILYNSSGTVIVRISGFIMISGSKILELFS